MTESRLRALFIIGVLLLAAGLRFYRADYAVDDLCLTAPQEYWLYDRPQVASLYAGNLAAPEVPALEDQVVTYPRARTLLPTSDDLRLARIAGILAGLVTVAITLQLGRALKSNWWLLAGLLVALAPWFTDADRWVVRFDFAPLAVATSVLALWYSRRNDTNPLTGRALVYLQLFSALSLLLIAPPLWWLAVGLVLLQPRVDWRFVVFAPLAGLAAFASLRSPFFWFSAAQEWDVGATAACVWALLVLSLWHFRQLNTLKRTALLAGIVLAGGIGWLHTAQLPQPTAQERELVNWLQSRIPDGVRVQFDAATWHLSSVAACPLGAHVAFDPLPVSPNMTVRPDFRVTVDPALVADASFVHDLGNGYYVGREIEFPDPIDIPFGDLLHLLNIELLTPEAAPGDTLNVRLDYQLSPTVTVDALRFAAFVHVTLPDQPGDKVATIDIPFLGETSVFGARVYVTNVHFRIPLPPDTASGTYDVLFGIYDTSSGERLLTPAGDSLRIGQVGVSAP
jgi:hypothetical protein